MSLQVQPKALSDALNRVVGAVERSKTMPILAHVMLTASGGFLTLRTTDLDIEITTAIECAGSMEATCAPMDKMQAIVARLTDRASASFEVEGSLLVVTSGRSRFTMPILPADMFPTLKMLDIGCSCVIEGKALAALLTGCATAIADDAARIYLNGLYLYAGRLDPGQGRKLCGVATDAYTLIAREVPADLPDDFPAIILPRKTVNLLGKMVAGYDEVSLELTDQRFVAGFGATRVTSKLVEGKFPDWRAVVPKVEPCLSYDSEALTSAIQNAYSAVQAEKSGRTLKLTIGEAETEFSTQSQDGTSGAIDICAHSLLGAPAAAAVGVNPKYFLEIIGAMAGETIQIGFADAQSTILVVAAGLDDRKAIIMPMRI